MTARPDAIAAAGSDFPIDPVLASPEAVDVDALRAAADRAMDTRQPSHLPKVLAELLGARTGDVIGLWLLATRHGEVDETARKTVTAQHSSRAREITLPYLAFTGPLPSPRPRGAACDRRRSRRPNGPTSSRSSARRSGR